MLMDLANKPPAHLIWEILAHCMEGKLSIRRGEFRDGFGGCAPCRLVRANRWTICYPELLGRWRGFGPESAVTEAIATIDRAGGAPTVARSRVVVAERLLRTKGDVTAPRAGYPSISAARTLLSEALGRPRARCLSWELRLPSACPLEGQAGSAGARATTPRAGVTNRFNSVAGAGSGGGGTAGVTGGLKKPTDRLNQADRMSRLCPAGTAARDPYSPDPSVRPASTDARTGRQRR